MSHYGLAVSRHPAADLCASRRRRGVESRQNSHWDSAAQDALHGQVGPGTRDGKIMGDRRMHYAVVEINSGRLVYCGVSSGTCAFEMVPGRFHAEAEYELEAQDAAAQKCVRYRARNGEWKPLPEVTVRRFNSSIITEHAASLGTGS